MKYNPIIYTSIILTLLLGGKAHGFNLDFERDSSNTRLDAQVLDKDATPIGNIWRSVKISTRLTPNPAGLFQSNCTPLGGVSTPLHPVECASNGLATGIGEYLDIEYNTPPQGNILIIEHNPGDGIPQNSPHGGIIRFDFDTGVSAKKIGIVDHAQGHIYIEYSDGSNKSLYFNHTHRNQLEFYDIPNSEVKFIEVFFVGDGGITGLDLSPVGISWMGGSAAAALGGLAVLKLFSQSPAPEPQPVPIPEPQPVPVPEPKFLLGTLVALGLGFLFKRKK